MITEQGLSRYKTEFLPCWLSESLAKGTPWVRDGARAAEEADMRGLVGWKSGVGFQARSEGVLEAMIR